MGTAGRLFAAVAGVAGAMWVAKVAMAARLEFLAVSGAGSFHVPTLGRIYLPGVAPDYYLVIACVLLLPWAVLGLTMVGHHRVRRDREQRASAGDLAARWPGELGRPGGVRAGAPRGLMRGTKMTLAIGSLLLGSGCAAAPIALTLFGVAAGTAAGAGVSHTLDGIAYKTFTVSLEGLHAATLMTLTTMDILVKESPDTEGGRKILAQAGDREVEIELDKLTSRTTRMRVTAKRNWLLRDRATATEIILQTDQTLTDNPHLAALNVETPRATAPAGSQ